MEKATWLNPQQHYEAAEQFATYFQIRSAQPNLIQISQILQKFAQLPYENLSKIIKLNQHWDLDPHRQPAEIIEDHLQNRLGGTCFSLTFFLKTILDYFGYQTDILMADMRSGANTHCALKLHFNKQEYLLDPGYLIQHPLSLQIEAPTAAIRRNVMLTREPETERFTLCTNDGKQIKQRYSFQNLAIPWPEFLQHWNRSFHWMTMHGLCLSKRDESGFIYLHDRYLKRQGQDLNFKGHFTEQIANVVGKYFTIPPEIVRRAERALKENLHHDKELGYRVPHRIQ
jgi:arylamine N-acetyltransferase